MKMIEKTNVCPDTPRSEMAQVVGYSHDHGYLYTNRKANAFVCGYRIPELNDKWKTTIPEKEQGSIFFVNFAVSEEPNRWTLLRMLREYLKANPDVKELCYYRRNSDTDFKRIIVRRSNYE
jgi:hypothetical protein